MLPVKLGNWVNTLSPPEIEVLCKVLTDESRIECLAKKIAERKPTVLIVDHDISMAKLVGRILESELGISYGLVKGSNEALAVLEKYAPKLIIIEYPWLQICNHIRHQPHTAEIPIFDIHHA